MRSSVDLVALPYVFSQSSLLTADQFIRVARDRGVFLSVDQLDALHRARVLVPLLRVSRTTRRIRHEIRTGGPFARQMAYWSPTEVVDVRAARTEGALHDPVNERVLGPSQRENRIGNITYASSMYLYCRQQLIHLPEVAGALVAIKWSREGNRIRGHLRARSQVRAQLMTGL